MRPPESGQTRRVTVLAARFAIAAALVALAVPVWRLGTGGPVSSPMPRSDARAALSLPVRDPSIVLRKSKRELELRSGGRPVRTYPIALGHSPVGDKLREGDGRTPEGDFTICAKNPNSSFHLSLQINYPGTYHADQGLRLRLISRADHARIVSAHRRGLIPPQKTALGGDIFIHGCGARRDWTLGCIAMENADIEDLYRAVDEGVPVSILP